MKPNNRVQRRRPLNIHTLGIFTLFCFALANFDFSGHDHRSLQSAFTSLRYLCRTYFWHDHWDPYWESIFADKLVYKDLTATAVATDDFNVGYVLTLIHCPGDDYVHGIDSQFDPMHAFYDAAALLRYSILQSTYPAGSRYNATMYAIVHPNAIRCNGPDGGEFDRVRVLQELQYHVSILGHPVGNKDLSDPYVKENIDKDVGIRDLMKLRSYYLENHPIVVMVDFRTFVVGKSDFLFDELKVSPEKKIAFTLDYPSHIPSTANTLGANMHWVLIKPNATQMETMINYYVATEYDPDWGWSHQGIKDFDGVLGLSGFLHHYFTRAESHTTVRLLSRCLYGNDLSDPFGFDPAGTKVCRDRTACDDCRLMDTSAIKVYKMGPTCGAPWDCHYDDNWEKTQKAACDAFFTAWFNLRMEFEADCWAGGPPASRNGTYHEEVFKGYCHCDGPSCYDAMLNDNIPLP